jgi:putative tryptophan/tyrosine transport system substrate-binding protein
MKRTGMLSGRAMRRREFVTLLGGATAWPVVVRAQQPRMPEIGFLSSTPAIAYARFVSSFLQGLRETGFIEGQRIAYRWGEGQYDRLPALAADLVSRKVALIMVGGGGVTALAAKRATSTIPIVFATGSDPVKLGLVASLNRPGGNVTGAYDLAVGLGQKRLQLLRDLLPQALAIGFLFNPGSPNNAFDVPEMELAARTLGLQLVMLEASTEGEIDAALVSVKQQGAAALVVQAEPFLFSRRDQLVALAKRYVLPTMYFERAFPAAGGLISYGADFADSNRQAGVYAGRILKGEKPSDLPVIQSTKLELIINLKTAKAFGIEVPSTLLAIADEVIE